ncbi:unnamed protein product [Meloidogyne enterolobii]|uniref:Uncharacterized protein n=1 Tax=Meloidogyne enterolobii TaxID=390850 RepID=A0ACB0Y6Q6_MELEN
MMLTRLTAIVFTIKHDKIWKTLLPLAIIVIFGLPLLDSYILFMDIYVIIPLPNEQNMTSFIIPPKELDKPGPYMYISFYYSIIFLVACAILNFTILFIYKNIKSSNKTNNQKKIERNLLIYALGTLFGHAIIAIVTIFLYVCPKSHSMPALFSLLPVVTDIGTSGLSSWLLLFISEDFRNEFLKDWRPKYFYRNSTNNSNNIIPIPNHHHLKVHPVNNFVSSLN